MDYCEALKGTKSLQIKKNQSLQIKNDIILPVHGSAATQNAYHLRHLYLFLHFYLLYSNCYYRILFDILYLYFILSFLLSCSTLFKPFGYI